MYSVLADAVLVLHFLFVLFVVLGGLLAVRWRWIVWAHIPAALWGVAIEFGGWICPLTPLENRLRALAGEPTYHGDFIARYLMPVIYPEGLTRETQVTLGFAALILNLLVYAIVLRRWRRPRGR
ncbi:MAG TPA: DUF2784 domain-containing protein [Vicinamibacterales bacterium]